MAVEPIFYSYEQGAIFPQEIVNPGETRGWIDRTQQLSRYIIVHCMKNNAGARIHIIDECDFDDTNEFGVTFARLDEENLVAFIPAGFGYELDVVDVDNEAGSLSLQHVMNDGTIQSLN